MRTRRRGKREPLSWGDRWRLSLATVGVLLVVGIVGVIKAPDSDDGWEALVRAGILLLSGLFCYWMYRISGERDADRSSEPPPR